jgi:hypothetical protein
MLILSACNKENGVCFSSTGPTVFQERFVAGFDSIIITDHVNVIILQDSIDRVIVESGQNILSGIITTVTGRELHIGNANQCNWLRSYSKPINVWLHVRNLMKIHYESSGNISSPDTLRFQSLKIDLWGGCGEINLLVNLKECSVIQHLGTATIRMTGVCGASNVYSGDFGLLRLDGMKSVYTYVKSSGSNDCYVNARLRLEATITSIGNIYFSGDPSEISEKRSGEGQLIPL